MEALGALVAEALVEMVGMSLSRPKTYSVEAVAEAVALDLGLF
jgi:hypothetical protein